MKDLRETLRWNVKGTRQGHRQVSRPWAYRNPAKNFSKKAAAV